MTKRRIVVTGVGIVSPIGIGKAAFLDSLRLGRSGIRRVSCFDPSSFPTKVAGEVSDFDPLKFLEPKKDAELIDLYCGVGLFSICFAEQYQKVIGIEEGNEAVLWAKKNAEGNGVSNSKFIEGKAENILPTLPLDATKHHVVIDPPRVGMKKEVVDALLRMPNIERLVYVSCNPGTLIRDLQLLSPRFVIQKVQPVDMFPQTKHLEAIVLLTPIA